MLNYIKGEGYRITHSRGMYVAAGIASGLLVLMNLVLYISCLLYTSPSPRDGLLSRMPSSA